jgi:Helix-turn-helix domain
VRADDLVSAKEAAKLLHIEPNTLAIWRCKKRYSLRHIKIGSKVFYRASEIDRFLDERTVESPGVAVSRKRKA